MNHFWLQPASEHFTQAAISITESQISDLGSYLPLSGGTMAGAINMGDNAINGVKFFNLTDQVVEFYSASGAAAGTDVYTRLINASDASTGGYVYLDTYCKNSAAANHLATRIASRFTDLTATTEDADLIFWSTRNGSLEEFMRLDGSANEVVLSKNLDLSSNSILSASIAA